MNSDNRLFTFVNRNAALEYLKELRKNPDAVNRRPDIRLALSIPEADMVILRQRYPVLVHGSTYEKKQFWERFKNSTESEPYRVYG